MNIQKANELFMNKLIKWAHNREDIDSVWLIGSSVYKDQSVHDQWSDLDIGFVVSEPSVFYNSMDWTAQLGELKVYKISDFFGTKGMKTIQLHFADHLMLDLGFFTSDMLSYFAESKDVGETLERGYKILVDKNGLLEETFSQVPKAETITQLLMPSEIFTFINSVSILYLHAARKVCRNDLYNSFLEIVSILESIHFPIIENYIEYNYGKIELPHLGFKNFNNWSQKEIKENLSEIFPELNKEKQWDSIYSGLKYLKKIANWILAEDKKAVNKVSEVISFTLKELDYLKSTC